MWSEDGTHFILSSVAETRKEEILQFNTAKTNVGFDKMLKVRELSPEHLEAQSQLRKEIGVCMPSFICA
jgi:hypothetical protein